MAVKRALFFKKHFSTLFLVTALLCTVSPLAYAQEQFPRLMVGGQSIGILLQTDGVTVVGFSPIVSENGEALYPAKEAGIEVDDFIMAINGQKISDNLSAAKIINQCGKEGCEVVVDYRRADKELQTRFKPLYCSDTQSYRSGLYIRDNTAGIGTLTYYNPVSGEYGALGHSIVNLQSNKEEVRGYIVPASISALKASDRGSPGEKVGVFLGNSWEGTISENDQLGIFGRLECNQGNFSNEYFPEPLEVAKPEEVELGSAEICTVIDDEKIEKFSVTIEKIHTENEYNGKGLVIKITDEALLMKTGGIIQGMSGSPIIQNGKLVGAVTHVFVNEPEKGYACFAEWMLKNSKI